MGTKQLVRSLWIILALILANDSRSLADRTEVLSTNPQKTAQVQRHQVGENVSGFSQRVEIIDPKNNRVLMAFSSIWHRTDAAWNEDGSLVYVNDRVGAAGDFLYIFRLTGDHVSLVRSPGDDSLLRTLQQLYRQAVQGRSKVVAGVFTIVAGQWKDNSSLQIHVSGNGKTGGVVAYDVTTRIDPAGQIAVDPLSEQILN